MIRAYEPSAHEPQWLVGIMACLKEQLPKHEFIRKNATNEVLILHIKLDQFLQFTANGVNADLAHIKWDSLLSSYQVGFIVLLFN